jgi:hypothetical protein
MMAAKPATQRPVEESVLMARPPGVGLRRSGYPIELVFSTLNTEKVVRVPLGGRPVSRVINGLAYHVRRRGGMRLRYQTATDGKAILAWVEPKRRRATA